MSTTSRADQPQTERKPLTAFERFIQFAAFTMAGLGVLAMLGYLALLWVKGYRVSTNVDPEVTALVGDFIGGVAGALFALAATLLFYLALTLQRREFQNSLEEMRISSQALTATEKHHEKTLEVMRQEKEFNVCLTAIKDLEEDWNELGGKASAWNSIENNWGNHFSEDHFFGLEATYRAYQIGADEPYRLKHYDKMNDLVQRASWVVNSFDEKTLAADDRKYLSHLVHPIILDMQNKIVKLVQVMIDKAKSILEKEVPYNGFDYDKAAIHKHCEVLEQALSIPINNTWNKI